jgi:hypothetical protein
MIVIFYLYNTLRDLIQLLTPPLLSYAIDRTLEFNMLATWPQQTVN